MTLEEWQEWMRARWESEPDKAMIPAPLPGLLPILTRPVTSVELASMPTAPGVH